MGRSNWAFVLLVTSGLAAGACVGGSKESAKPADDESLKAFILEAAPGDVGAKLNVNFDDKITLLGAKVTPAGAVKPGQRVKVTMYWKSEKPLPEKDWKLFTHILDTSGERVLNIDNVGPLRRIKGATQVLSPSRWEAGKVYVDEQTFTLPKKIKTNTVQITVGIWRGDDRLTVKAGRHDKNRAIVATLETAGGGAEAKPESSRVPKLRVDKLAAGEKITIDGKLEEAGWKTAPSTGAFVDVRTGRKNASFPVNGSTKLLWDADGFYVGFEIQDADVVGGFDAKGKDPHLWTKDTVEIMVDPDGDGDNKDYYEIQINPQNLVFDSQFDTYNQPKKGADGPFGHEEWTANLKSAAVVKGTIDKKEDKDEGYVVEAMIPWKSLDKAKKAPPEIGDQWRINFYAMQQNGGVSWSPILGQGNFHRASRFGQIIWAEKGWTPPVPEKATAEGDETATAMPPGSGQAAAPASGAPPRPSAAPSASPPAKPEKAEKKPATAPGATPALKR